jgi:hypothetical protein
MIRAAVSGDDLAGLGDELEADLAPQMIAAVDAGTDILVKEWKSVASRTSGSGRRTGGEQEIVSNVRSSKVGGQVFSRKGRGVLRTERFTVNRGKEATHQGAGPGEPLTKITGEYVGSIVQGKAKLKGHQVSGYAVARVDFAARDEFGGKDSRGRYVPPHPTARVAEAMARRRILDTIDAKLGLG